LNLDESFCPIFALRNSKSQSKLLLNDMQAILSYLKQNEKRFVSELCDYVRFPSVSAQHDKLREVDG